MKKILVLLLLMVFSTSLFAEWTKVTGSSDGDMTVYVDSDSIKKKGNKVTMLTLLDYKVVQVVYPNHNSYKSAANYLSDVNHKEYDCENKKSRLLDLYRYSGNMREGEIVNSQSNIKMKGTSVLPNSMEEDVFKIACGNELTTINENIVINTLFGVFVDEDIRMAVISLVYETLGSALFFWWVTYYFMIKRKKIIVKKHKILTHFIIILSILTFLISQDKNSLANGFFGVVAIVLSIVSCLILKKSSNNMKDEQNDALEKFISNIINFVAFMLILGFFILPCLYLFGFDKEFTDIFLNAWVNLNYGWWILVVTIFILAFCENILNFFRGNK